MTIPAITPATSFATTHIAEPPPGKAPVTAARAAMTPETGALVNDKALDYRLGKDSMARTLNDTVRYRVEGTGPMGKRAIVPDSAAAAALSHTKQGAALVNQLHVAASSIDGFEGVSNLKGFMLAKNVDSVVAGTVLGGADTGDPESKSLLRSMGRSGAATSKALRANVRDLRSDITNQYQQGVAAWNQDGWIIFRPDVSRALLTSVGAYTPAKGAPVRRSRVYSDIVNHVPTHEVQHSASPVSPTFYSTPGKWMEEAVAEVLSDTPGIKERTARKTGVNVHSYSAEMSHPSPIDIGWKTWHLPAPNATQIAENHAAVSRNYTSSQQDVRDLLHLAGYSWGNDANLAKMRTFLQAKPSQDLPSELSHAIATRFGVPVSRRHELTQRIASLVDDPHGIAHLRDDFGLKQPVGAAQSTPAAQSTAAPSAS